MSLKCETRSDRIQRAISGQLGMNLWLNVVSMHDKERLNSFQPSCSSCRHEQTKMMNVGAVSVHTTSMHNKEVLSPSHFQIPTKQEMTYLSKQMQTKRQHTIKVNPFRQCQCILSARVKATGVLGCCMPRTLHANEVFTN